MDTKKRRVFKVIKDVALFIWSMIKSACIGFVVTTLTFVFTALFCRNKAEKVAAAIGAFALGSAASVVVAKDDKSVAELADDIVAIADNIKAKKVTE